MGYLRDKLEEATSKKTVKWIIGIVIVIGIYLGVSAIAHIWPFSIATGIVSEVTDPHKIISDYQWFYDQKAQIDASKANLAAAKEAFELSKGTDTNSLRLTDYTGLKMILNNQIQQYNSRSKQKTRNMWKAEDLPYEIQMVNDTIGDGK